MILNQFLFFLCFVLCCDGDQFDEECGLEEVGVTPLVRGGLKVQPNHFPWHVALFLNVGDQFKQVCGGSLVRMQLVITAAHCFSEESTNHRYNETDYQVVGGILNSSWTSREEFRQASEVLKVLLGERYGGVYRNFQDDIALVLLMTKFTFSDMVRPVCLDLVDRALDTRQTSPGSVGKVAGWGLTGSGTSSESLKYLRVPVVGDKECIRKLGPKQMRYMTTEKICAGVLNGSAVCRGDSGGGLVFPLQATRTSPPRWYLRGVVSNSESTYDLHNPCQYNTLALYTSLYKQQVWLSENMNELLAQGVGCTVRGSNGDCREFSACPGAMEESLRGIPPQHCSPFGLEVCCAASCPPLPPSTVTVRKTGSKANDYCVGLAEQIFPCQKNGSVWRRGDFCGPEPDKYLPGFRLAPLAKASPSEVQRYTIVEISLFEPPLHLISERWLLGKASQLELLAFFPRDNISPPPKVVFTIIMVMRHPNYRHDNRADNDIALLEMDRPMAFTRRMWPFCLPTPLTPVGGFTITRQDFGGTSWEHWPAVLLPREECGRVFPPGGSVAPDGVTDHHLCVTLGPGVKCPMLVFNYLTASNGLRVACTRLLVGLFIQVKQKDDTCSVLYLRVAHYVPWVERVVWP